LAALMQIAAFHQGLIQALHRGVFVDILGRFGWDRARTG